MNFTEFFTTFPEMSKSGLRAFKKSVDGAYRQFSREYGDAIEAVFDPVLFFLIWFEKLLQNSPWIVVLIVFLALIYFGSRSIYFSDIRYNANNAELCLSNPSSYVARYW